MLRFIQKRDRYGFPEKAHITDGTGKCLCGVDAEKDLPDPENPVRKTLASPFYFLNDSLLETLTAKAIETLVQN